MARCLTSLHVLSDIMFSDALFLIIVNAYVVEINSGLFIPHEKFKWCRFVFQKSWKYKRIVRNINYQKIIVNQICLMNLLAAYSNPSFNLKKGIRKWKQHDSDRMELPRNPKAIKTVSIKKNYTILFSLYTIKMDIVSSPSDTTDMEMS